jgi:hypothetical protein
MENLALIASTTDQEQRSYVKLSLLLKKSSGVIYKELTKTLGKTRALSLRTVERWTSDLRNEFTTFTSNARSDRQKTASGEAYFDQLEDSSEVKKLVSKKVGSSYGHSISQLLRPSKLNSISKLEH